MREARITHLRAAEGSSDSFIFPEDDKGMGLGNPFAFFTYVFTPKVLPISQDSA